MLDQALFTSLSSWQMAILDDLIKSSVLLEILEMRPSLFCLVGLLLFNP